MDLADVLAVLGVLLMFGAVIAGLAQRTFLSLTAVFVIAGLVLGRGGLGVLEFDPTSGFVETLAVIALILILFRDGLEVEEEMLQQAWRPPLRKLVLAMPLTCVLVACVTKALTDLGWTEAFLVGALLSPTDPVLSSSVVTNPRVPRIVRHSLNLESGLNDGLALPAVLAFAYSLDPTKSDFVWWRFVLQDVTLGFAVGIGVGLLASVVMTRSRTLSWEVTPHNKAMGALGVAFTTYALAHAVHGNGLIAVFVCAITLGIRRPDIRESFEGHTEDIIEIVKLGIFVVFGAVLTFDGLFQDGAAAVAIVLLTLVVVRPVSVLIALVGTRTDLHTRLFMGWFGPKGVATMTFSLFVLGSQIQAGERIFNIAALAVVVSIVVHGLTDTPGSEAIARHAERVPAETGARTL
ncbi:MAG TPA: cation:proton antiporter [Thermoleophilaceae bacterium]|jgi:NhaP-type Na+/H+ or K+/H+ antiporter|nr:cation:proton antiporter [Thermoleophilaceae bacterium]